MALPSGYTPLEYIESTGGQYIDTCYIATSENQRVVCDVTFTATHVAQSICGSQNASSGMGTIIPHSLDGTTFDLYCAGGFPIKVAGSLNTRYTLDITANRGTMTASINGSQYSGTYSGTIISGHSIAVFANNVGGSYNQVINGLQMRGLSLYDNGTLVRDYIPVQRADGTVGLLDQVNYVFYPDAAGGNFVSGPVLEWTELEYIESSGTQYIDTRFIPTSENLKIHSVFSLTKLQTWRSLFGSENGANGPWSLIAIVNDALKLVFYTGNSAGVGGVTVLAGTLYDLTCQVNSGKLDFSCNDVSGSVNVTGTVNKVQSLYIFTQNSSVPSYTTSQLSSMRLYACQIYDNGTLVRDYVPAQLSNGRIGLVDRLTGLFYGNAGSGVFIAGPVIPDVPEADPIVFEVLGVTMRTVSLAWGTGNPGQRFRLYRNDALIYEGTGMYYTDLDLIADTPCSYRIAGYNGSTESDGLVLDVRTTDAPQLITDRTAGDVSAGRRKGRYNAIDLIRVGEAMAYLEERFADVGISVSVSPKLDWQLSDIPTQAQALHYLEDVGVLRGKLAEYRETVTAPDSLTALTWGGANDIETILLETEKLIQDIILSYRYYAGRTYSGVNALP